MTVTINASTSSGLITTADNSGILGIQTAGTTALTIDASQNAGLGVVPSAWGSGYKAMQVGSQLSVAYSGGFAIFSNNAYNNSGNKYIASDFATQYYQQAGQHVWGTAASGTSGNAITFTQAMTLTADGNLALGSTTANQPLKVAKDGYTTGAGWKDLASITESNSNNGVFLGYPDTSPSNPVGIIGATSTSNASALAFWTFNGSAWGERARIDSSGNLLVNTTSQTFNGRFCVNTALNGGSFQTTAGASSYSAIVGARSGNIGNVAEWWYSVSTMVGTISITSSTTAYNTSSDYRLKNTILPMTGALAKVALLKPVTYKWNIDDSDGEGFIAHELAEVIPHAVTGEKDAVDEEGNPKYQGIDTSFLVATLTAAIQEQQAIIESLTQRITALEGA